MRLKLTTDLRDQLFRENLREAGIPQPTAEHRFCPPRRFRFDYCWLEQKLALEVEGWGHKTNKRFMSDLVKYNLAVIGGWRILRTTPRLVTRPDLSTLIGQALGLPHTADQPSPV